MRYFIIYVVAIAGFIILMGSVSYAAQGQGEAGLGAQNFERKVELATKMHMFRPSKTQVDIAIAQIASRYPLTQAESFKSAMRRILNYKAIEKISIDAMVETYSTAELEAMVEYYAKPEAQSAAEKYQSYAGKVQPELIKMIDKAMMRLKAAEN